VLTGSRIVTWSNRLMGGPGAREIADQKPEFLTARLRHQRQGDMGVDGDVSPSGAFTAATNQERQSRTGAPPVRHVARP
jgi:hypothetical protein